MEIEKERLSGRTFMPPWVILEHECRFYFAAEFVGGKVVVDCACGSGVGAEQFATASAAHVYAYDIDQETIDQNKVASSVDNLEYQCASACSLPLDADSCDVFISLETIEHLDNDTCFLDEVVRVTKSEGTFICSTPNRELTNPGSSLQSKPWNSFHVREYSAAEFIGLLGEHFVDVQLYGQNRVSRRVAGLCDWLARVFGTLVAVRVNQFFKLPRFIIRQRQKHQPEEYRDGCRYEYMIAVCRSPRAAAEEHLDND
jgi:SAM-dependent methyltransferase